MAEPSDSEPSDTEPSDSEPTDSEPTDTEPRDAVADLRRIAFLLERTLQSSYRVKAFRGAAGAAATLPEGELEQAARGGSLTKLKGIGDTTATCIAASLAGQVPEYLAQLEETATAPLATGGESMRALLRGDCHTHSDWSDGGSPIPEMAVTAIELGHDYAVLTDHSPRLKVANGLTPQRLRRQLGVLDELRGPLAPFRLLSGIEVDILDDGALDQESELLALLDVVVASVHSVLKMPREPMTDRMLAAIRNPHTDILGHCTGRMVSDRNSRGGKGRPPSQFDARAVFAACAEAGVAVEINCRPERLDPPMALLNLAIEAGCLFSIDTDAHAPGQLDWQQYGCARAVSAGVDPANVVNTWPLEDLLTWTEDHGHRPPAPSTAAGC